PSLGVVGVAAVEGGVPQPAGLGRVGLGVEDDDVPRPQVVAVVAEAVRAGRAGRRRRRRAAARAAAVEVGEVVGRLGTSLVLVVARRGAGAALDAGLSPGRVVAVLVGGGVATRAGPAEVLGPVADAGPGGWRVGVETVDGRSRY